MTEVPTNDDEVADLPWTIELDLLKLRDFPSESNLIDLVIARYLASGDPRPFSWWVSNGHRPSDRVIMLLARMLNPKAPMDDRFPYIFQPKQRRPKRGHPSKGPEDKVRDLLIALSVQKRMNELGPGSYDAVLLETAEWVGVSVATVKRAYDNLSKVLPPLD
jgi:hypothetical protein